MPEINRRQPLCGAPSLQPLVHQLTTPTCANNHGNKLLCGCRMKQISQATNCVMPFAKRLAQYSIWCTQAICGLRLVMGVAPSVQATSRLLSGRSVQPTSQATSCVPPSPGECVKRCILESLLQMEKSLGVVHANRAPPSPGECAPPAQAASCLLSFSKLLQPRCKNSSTALLSKGCMSLNIPCDVPRALRLGTMLRSHCQIVRCDVENVPNFRICASIRYGVPT